MPPLPKIVGVLGVLAAIFGALNSAEVLAVLPQKMAAIVTAASAIVAALSHSLTGTGGKK